MCESPEKYVRLLDEYREAGINVRHYGEVRFKQLTVFLSATAGLGAALFSGTVQAQDVTKRWVLGLGLAVVIAFFVLEERATYYRRAYMYVLLGIERKLEFSQYRQTRNPFWLSSRYVYRCLFVFIAVAWVFLGVPLERPHPIGAVAWTVETVLTTILLNIRFERYQGRAEALLLPQAPSNAPTIAEPQEKDR